MRFKKFLFLSLFLINFSSQILSYSFEEKLNLNILPDSKVYFYFEFKSKWSNSKESLVENFDSFPKIIGDLVSKFDIDELSLSLSQGKWKYNQWGMPIDSAPSGGELWTAFKDQSSQKIIDSYWLQSSRAISGLFGLSINLEENPNTAIPTFSILSNTKNNSNIRYASIPNEIVCTENLTPWIKLLPCAKSKGIAQLFKTASKLFESQYFMINLNFKRTCMDSSCTKFIYDLKQTLSLINNVDIITRQLNSQEITWSFQNIFHNKITGSCPVAQKSTIILNLDKKAKTTLIPTSKSDELFIYDLKEYLKASNDFNPTLVQKREIDLHVTSPISIHRFITDKNEINFGIKTLITNKNDKEISLIYFDTIPWYFRVYISSLTVKDEEKNLDFKPESIAFRPGIDRQKPHQIEINLKLRPKAIYSIFFRADFGYLKWDEFPPDVNHGFYINPVLVTINPKEENVKMYSEPLLMNLPTPDFSMPYNVICLTCTAIAIGFGSFHNFTTRKFKFFQTKTLIEKKMNQIKKSATLIISSGLQKNVNNYNYKVMLLKRNSRMKAAPNFHVYPGGKYDEAIDESLNWLDVFFHSRDLERIKSNPVLLRKIYFNDLINQNSIGNLIRKQLENDLSLPVELSYRLCAIRETFEETGLLLAVKKHNLDTKAKFYSAYFTENFDQLKHWHSIIKKDSSQFMNMFLKLNIVPDVFGLHEWANWITPAHEKFRFDTFFFTCFLNDLPSDDFLDINTDEIDSLEFYNPDEALEKNLQNKIKFIPPQLYEFSRIKRFADISKFAEYSLQRQKYGLVPWLPIFVNNRRVGLLPGDYMYQVVSEQNVTDVVAEPTDTSLKLNRIIRNDQDPTRPIYKIICNFDFDGIQTPC